MKVQCVTVTGVLEDVTKTQKTHHSDGVRHEPDGDTHGWLRPDPQYRNLLNAGNMAKEDSDLVFELVCHFSPRADSAKASCGSNRDSTVLPPTGSHVAITGTFVQDLNHGKWNEIHPVTSIEVH